MSILILSAGVQSTIQASQRRRMRQAGVPWGGPADPVSMALANRLVGQPHDTPAIEIAYGPAAFKFDTAAQLGIAGASAIVRVGGVPKDMHETINIAAGQSLEISRATAGARIYLALRGELSADMFLGSASTYLPAGLGGHEGRALVAGDQIGFAPADAGAIVATPDALRLPAGASYALRVVPGTDLGEPSLFDPGSLFRVSPRLSRMGVEIDGAFSVRPEAAVRPSSAVFPGALQVTPRGQGFLLLCDGQTTGGYPHLLQVIRADRHLLGQLRPGDSIRFLMRSQEQAEAALKAKQALLSDWMPGFEL